ncbi:MAG: DNA replication/repair protein RecF [Sporomusaceae bacterium]|jgi:DNA replication and repair protein RecF|nr:DNA replication/repair protein RecF [Sporomusaceae bacterium]
MRVHSIELLNYRNYTAVDLEFSKSINIFTGNNAQGKTNLLESLYFAAMGRSHRTGEDKELIMWEKENACIKIKFSRRDVENFLKIKLINGQNKEIILNGNTINARELLGSLTAVIFSPEDLLMIKGAPVLRRRFLDNEISQASKTYYRQLLNYNRILSQRNNLLKKIRERKADRSMLESWDGQFVKSASYLVLKRQEVVKKLTMIANLCHRKITSSKENLAVIYCLNSFSGKVFNDLEVLSNWYSAKLKENEAEDILRGSTGIGPHRDDLMFLVNGKNLKNFGSQGQQRTGVLALKLAELEFIKSETGEYPVLLLDDIMSELDENRRNELLLFIKERIQTFITATDQKYFADEKIGQFYKIENGMVSVI